MLQDLIQNIKNGGGSKAIFSPALNNLFCQNRVQNQDIPKVCFLCFTDCKQQEAKKSWEWKEEIRQFWGKVSLTISR